MPFNKPVQPSVSVGPKRLEKRARVAQPPYLDLAEAIRIAEQIYEQGGGKADKNLLTVILKNTTSSSSFIRKLQCLRWYHLTTGMVPPVVLTDAALSIVAPKDEAARLAALKTAAVGLEQFRRTYERLKGKLLPQKEYLINGFQHDLEVPKPVATEWAESFTTALETARLLHVRPDGKTQVLEGAASPSEAAIETSEEQPVSAGTTAEQFLIHDRAQPQPVAAAQGEGHTTRITLSDGRIATIFIPDRLSSRDGVRLKGALTGIAAIIDSMVEEEP